MSLVTANKTACLIVGMHRSGTSVVSKLVSVLGADLGHSIMQPREDNPSGFWENEKVMELNDELLLALGSRWDWLMFRDSSEYLESLLVAFGDRASTLIDEEFSAKSFISIKDPRISVLIPFWRSVLEDMNYSVKLVLVSRNPAEVALSLNERNGLSAEFSDVLWFETITAVFRAAQDFLLIDYRALLCDPEQVVEETAKYLNVDQREWVSGIRSYTETFLDEGLNHWSDRESKTGQGEAEKLYAGLIRGEAAEVFDRSRISEVLREFEKSEFSEDRIYLVYLKDLLEGASNPLSTDSSERVLLNDKESKFPLYALMESVGGVVSERAALEQREGLAEKEIEDLEVKFAALATEYDKKVEEKENIEAAYSEECRSREWLDQKLEEERAAREYLEGKRQEELAAMKWLQEKLKESEIRTNHWMVHLGEALEAIERSKRWRLGDGMVTWINRLRGRKRTEQALDDATGVVREYRNWVSAKGGCFGVAGVSGVPVDAFGVPLPLDGIKEQLTAEAEEGLESFLASDRSVGLKCSESADVSIVLVFYNRAELSYRCLQSIAESCSDLEYEVIIVDNASSDQSRDLLSKVKGAKIVLNEDNLGFLKACNQSLNLVTGECTLFLNNDAELLENALGEALRTLGEDETIGAVGGRIVLLDGRLQEAGSIVWSDGSCLGYGREKEPDSYPFLFQRDVDYCSGVFLLTRTELFKSHGGFDERYAPAYYEESDYCLWLWEQGYRVVYAPGAVVRHFEFASSQSSSEATELMRRNQAEFVGKHKAQLEKKFPPNAQQVLVARHSTFTAKKNILYIDDRVPHGYFGSGFPRSNFVLNSLAELGYQVTLLPLNFPHEETLDSLYADIDRRVEIAFGVGREGFRSFWEERKSAYDVVWVSRPHNMEFVAEYLKTKRKDCKVIYDAEAIFADRAVLEAQIVSSGKEEKSHRQLLKSEMLIAAKADAVVAVCEKDMQVFGENLPGGTKVGCVGFALEVTHCDVPLSERTGLLFVGNLDEDGSPNVDSLLWFYRGVWPRIKAAEPDTCLNIVGSNRASSLKEISDPDIVFHGRVDVIDQFYQDARVFIAPTRFAAGMPYKVYEAASHCLPSVATDLLSQQLGWRNGDDLLVSAVNDAESFSANCQVLLKDDEKWNQVSRALGVVVAGECGADSIKKEILEVFDSLA